MAALVVIRGNSASGKSTVAADLQRRFEHGCCAVVGQDVVRRQIIRERDESGAWNIELIEHIATLCLGHGMVTIVEGILDADRYGSMLYRLAATAGRALHYGFDLAFDETLACHAGRPQAATIPPDQLAEWYHGWQPLSHADEVRFDSSWSCVSIVERIHTDILATTDGYPDGTD